MAGAIRLSPFKEKYVSEKDGSAHPVFQKWLDLLFESVRGWSSADKIEGCVPTSAADSSHDITFTAGELFVGGKVYGLPAFTKQFDVAFAVGNNAGGYGVTLPATGVFYIFAIRKNASPGVVDYYGDTSATGANAPSGWTVLGLVFETMTDGSNNFRKFASYERSGGGLKVKFDVPVNEFSEDPGNDNEQIKTLVAIPPSREGILIWELRDATPAADSSLFVTETSMTNTAADITVSQLYIDGSGGAAAIPATAKNAVEIYLDSSRQIRYRTNGRTEDMTVRCTSHGYFLERV